MSPLRLICAAALAAALASPAFAAPGDETMTAPPEGAVNAPASGTDTSATVAGGATTITTPAGEVVVLRSSPTPVAEAYRLKAGDANVVSNSPIPDTVENRRAYGQPMSNGGRATAPAGN